MYDFIWQGMAEKIMANKKTRGLILMSVDDLANVMKEAFGDDRIADTWTIGDVQGRAKEQHGIYIPDEDARVILHEVFGSMDAETGINWYVFDWLIQEWMDKNGIEEGTTDDYDTDEYTY